MRSVFRFVEYTTRQDPTAEPAYEATCVVGEEEDCGATSGDMASDEIANRWMAEHFRDTGHNRFRRTYADYATVSRKE